MRPVVITRVEELKDTLAELFDRAVVAMKELDRVYDTYPSPTSMSPPPQPKVVESLDDWIAYKQALDDYEAKRDEARVERFKAESQVDEVLNKLIYLIPPQVWFKHGDHAVGIHDTGFGANRYELRVVPWSDKLPSLGGRHRGD